MLGWWVAVSAVAGGPTHVDVRACRERVAAVDALFLAGRTDEAWAAAEESGRACAAVGLRARPRDADRWYRRYDDLVEEGLNDEALPFATREAIATLASQGPGHAETATSLNGLALLLMETGAYDLAERHLRRALDVRRRILEPDHPLLAQSLNNLALLYQRTGTFDVALPLNLEALDVAERAFGDDHPNTAIVLTDLAGLYHSLGRYQDAIATYQRALDIRERVFGRDHPAIANSLNNLAVLYDDMGSNEDALELYRRALSIDEQALGPNHPDTLIDLSNYAMALGEAGSVEAAVPLFRRALNSYERVLGPDHPRTASSLNQLAWLYRSQGDLAAARPLVDRALPVAFATRDADTRCAILAGAADQSAAEGDLPAAVLWGKLAVRATEDLRAHVAAIGDDDLTTGFVDQYEATYRALADRLVALGRIPEAEQVLALLKTEEQLRFLRRDSAAVGGDSVALTQAEQAWLDRFDAIRTTVVADAQEFDALRKAAARGTLPPDRQARLEELTARRADAAQAIDVALGELRAALATAHRDATWTALALDRTDRVQRQLKALGKGTVLVHAIVLDDHLLLLLTTPDAQVAEKVPVPAEDLHRAVAAFRQALTDPGADPRAAGKQLYDWLLRPLEGHLAQAGAQTLLTSLDGTLRYVPIAALHDGQRFVVEKWATSVYTPAAEADLARPAVEEPFVAAFGASQGATVDGLAFSPLPSIPAELDAVVRADEGDAGAVAGKAFLDEAFTAAALSDALHLETPWVHLASHFHFAPGGTEADSFLLLGDGHALSVADLRRGDYPLAGVDLLALSACQTALGERRADGSEVEGLAVVAQNQGAAAVLATLWPVADASTAAWMAALYQGQVEEPVARAVAVQRVQLAFLGGDIDGQHLPDAARGLVATRPAAATGAPAGLEGWRHPYHWAPFVLYGAGR